MVSRAEAVPGASLASLPPSPPAQFLSSPLKKQPSFGDRPLLLVKGAGRLLWVPVVHRPPHLPSASLGLGLPSWPHVLHHIPCTLGSRQPVLASFPRDVPLMHPCCGSFAYPSVSGISVPRGLDFVTSRYIHAP